MTETSLNRHLLFENKNTFSSLLSQIRLFEYSQAHTMTLKIIHTLQKIMQALYFRKDPVVRNAIFIKM
jgi:hypothetical protein